MTNWYYPNVMAKIAPKNMRCSDCEITIIKHKEYFKHNHGRYCHKCSELYDGKYAKVDMDGLL